MEVGTAILPSAEISHDHEAGLMRSIAAGGLPCGRQSNSLRRVMCRLAGKITEVGVLSRRFLLPQLDALRSLRHEVRPIC